MMQTQRRMGGSIGRGPAGAGRAGSLSQSARATGRLVAGGGQEMRPRKSHRRGNDALPRGLCPDNEEPPESLGRSLEDRANNVGAVTRSSEFAPFRR
jgi:hypothetical protein